MLKCAFNDELRKKCFKSNVTWLWKLNWRETQSRLICRKSSINPPRGAYLFQARLTVGGGEELDREGAYLIERYAANGALYRFSNNQEVVSTVHK